MKLTERFEEIIWITLQDISVERKRELRDVLIQAVRERDQEAYPGKKLASEEYREIDSDAVAKEEGWNDALDQYKENLVETL